MNSTQPNRPMPPGLQPIPPQPMGNSTMGTFGPGSGLGQMHPPPAMPGGQPGFVPGRVPPIMPGNHPGFVPSQMPGWAGYLMWLRSMQGT
jgi:hypothetical protein